MNDETQALFIIGDSHYAAVARALADRDPARYVVDRPGIDVYVFNAWKYSLTYPFSVVVDARWALNQELRAEMETLAAPYAKVAILSMFGGGHHHALTLVAHPQPFDCVLPDAPEGPLLETAQLLTVGYIEAILMTWLPGPLREMANLTDAFPESRRLHAEPPPTVSDEAFIQVNLGKYFTDMVPEGTVPQLTPPYVRQKVWRIQTGLMKKGAAERGYEFLDAPAASMDEDGFLKREYFGPDATHANAPYGELVLQQLEQALDANIRRWSMFG